MTIFLELFEKSWGIPSRHRLVVSVLKLSNDWMIWGYPTIFGFDINIPMDEDGRALLHVKCSGGFTHR